jgi:hypothetical protein
MSPRMKLYVEMALLELEIASKLPAGPLHDEYLAMADYWIKRAGDYA